MEKDIKFIKGYLPVNVVSDSMYPLLRKGEDIAVFKPLEAKAEKSDVLLIKRDGKYLIRRVIAVTLTGYIVRGDNSYKNLTVYTREVIGKLDFFLRNGVKIHDVGSPSVKTYAKLQRLAYPYRKLKKELFK